MTYRVLSGEALFAAGASAGPILGLDTGSAAASLGVVAGSRVRASISRPVKSHGSDLPNAMEEALRIAGLKLRDLTAIAVALGPGSFTGLRIGLSYAKGLAMALGLRLVGVPTLDAMALCAVGSPFVCSGVTICPVLDARKGEIYAALYRPVDDALEKVVGEQVAPLEDFALRISGEVVFVGESKAEDARMLLSRKGRSAATVDGAALRASMGGFVAALGAARVARNDVDDIVALEPLYLRPPDASIRAPEVSLNASAKPGEDSYGTSRGRANPAACRP